MPPKQTNTWNTLGVRAPSLAAAQLGNRSLATPSFIVPKASATQRDFSNIGLTPQQLRALGLLPATGRPAGPSTERTATTHNPADKRKDAPTQLATPGAQRARIAGPLSAADRDAFKAELIKDVTASSASSSRATQLRTWHDMHRKWMGTTTPTFPITVDSLTGVASLFKAAKYRSFGNYHSAAKNEHIRLGFEWTQQLALCAKECSRSVNRGIGPPKQAGVLDLQKVVALGWKHEPIVEGGPCSPIHMFCVGALWLTRELEISSALACHWTRTVNEVTWLLPVSKTDTTALGAERSLGCLCQDGNLLCPYHLAFEHLTFLYSRFCEGSKPWLRPGLPLFPNRDGGFVSKDKVVQTIVLIAQALQQPVTDEFGRNIFGGHSMRVSGARHYAGLGLELFKLQVLARWTSPVILRYVAESPLTTITKDCRQLMSGSQHAAQVTEVASWPPPPPSPDAREHRDDLSEEEGASRAAHGTQREHTGYAYNPKGRCWHRISADSDGAKTICGWAYHGKAVVSDTLDNAANHIVCGSCLRVDSDDDE